MNLSYGTAKTGVTTITNASVQFTEDTDLGIQTNFQQNTVLIPNKGAIKTTGALVIGSGYSVGFGNIICSSTGGSGTGATFTCRTGYSVGALIANRSLTFNPGEFNENITISLTSTGAPITGSTTAITGVSANGTAASFILSSKNGLINKCSVVASGTGYIEGETISFTKVAIEAGFGAGRVTNLPTGGVLNVGPLAGDISGSIIQIVSVDGGSRYTIGDTLTLQEIGSSNVGTAQVDVLTLDLGQSLNSSPNNRYPKAIMISTAGATAAAPAAVTVKDLEGNFVTMQGMLTGVIRPFSFTQVTLSTGETPTIGEVTIYY